MSVVRLVRAVLPGMREAKFGRFLNFGTVAIKEPHRWHYLYGSK
jgi:NADP-dependent 3-hydroxy acid dehydrogenase YdfG